MAKCSKCNTAIEGRPNFCPACGCSITYGFDGTNDPLIGRILDGTFSVDRLVGEGAMGRVYLGQHTQLKKKVALKILRTNLVSDTTVVRRFEREALAASRLNHPHCISIFGFGREPDDLLWMAMEYVEGRDLGVIIAEDSPLPTQRVAHIMSQVCQALDEAHAANVIHRDLKPANIVCIEHRQTKDFVKVLDFGIAKIVDTDSQQESLTREGIVCGTPAYMSPEQVQGLELDNRSDLFGLGVILYQTLTGSLPFYGPSAVEVATKIVLEQPLTPSEARADWSYPPELEAIVLKLLSKAREDRYDNALEVKTAIEDCLSELQDRRDASLDLRPDELAELIAQTEGPSKGTDTIRISGDLVEHLLRPNSPPPQAAPPVDTGIEVDMSTTAPLDRDPSLLHKLVSNEETVSLAPDLIETEKLLEHLDESDPMDSHKPSQSETQLNVDDDDDDDDYGSTGLTRKGILIGLSLAALLIVGWRIFSG